MSDAIFVNPVPFHSSALAKQDCKTWPDISSFLKQEEVLVANHRGRVAQPLYCFPHDISLRESLHEWLVTQGIASAASLSDDIAAALTASSCSPLSVVCLPVYLASLILFPSALCGILQASNVLACNVPSRVETIVSNMTAFNKRHKHIRITFAVREETDCCANKSWMPLRKYQQQLQLYICFKSHFPTSAHSPMTIQMEEQVRRNPTLLLKPVHRMDKDALQTWLRRKTINTTLLHLLEDFTGSMLLELDENNIYKEWNNIEAGDIKMLKWIIQEAKKSEASSSSSNSNSSA